MNKVNTVEVFNEHESWWRVISVCKFLNLVNCRTKSSLREGSLGGFVVSAKD